MKIFLSAMDMYDVHSLQEYGCDNLLWNLLSYYQIRTNAGQKLFDAVHSMSESIMIDSGAHSFQKGAKVDWVEYTKKYAEFIRKNDSPKIVGFFEMDVDNILGYKNVLSLREILERESDKIIPVWHKNRGVEDYKEMCHRYAGKVVAVTGFRNEDIRDEQYLMFLKYARQHNCRVHCLGMTRRNILDNVPFDYTDSATWKLKVTYGKVTGVSQKLQTTSEFRRTSYLKIRLYEYLKGMEMQRYYHTKWQKICND